MYNLAKKKFFFTLMLCFCLLTSLEQVSHADNVVQHSYLLDALRGFGENTSGGLGGNLYIVNRLQDDNTPGSLRYAVENSDQPLWIIFDPSIFPPEVESTIQLVKPLNLRDNLTIDGRGAQVMLAKYYHWQDAEWDAVGEAENGYYECRAKENTVNDMGPLIKIRSAKNIIISHIKFAQRFTGVAPEYSLLDKQCFGDVITIYNTAQDQDNRYFDNIWVNQSDFSDCADECIAITRGSSLRRAYITLSHNHFADSHKGLLIGTDFSAPFSTAVSLYGNYFDACAQRCPRVQNSYVHFFNNAISAWRYYAVGAFNNTRVMLEDNIFIADIEPRDAWQLFENPNVSTQNAYIWARNNQYLAVNEAENYTTRSFPSAATWYYEDGLTTPLPSDSNLALTQIANAAGWVFSSNDLIEN